MTVKPYKKSEEQKKKQVEQMFDNIAHRYDFLNHFLSLGIDKLWRRKAVAMLASYPHDLILDVATGTGDFAIASTRLSPKKVTGFDLSANMIGIGQQKVEKLGLQNVIEFVKGDSENMPFEEEAYDAVTVGFGVRNFENIGKGLAEFHRILKKDGVAVILEFSKPRYFPMKQLYRFYFLHILPRVGNKISKDSSAYSYLPESVMAFPDDQDFLNILKKAGFKSATQKRLTFGIATIYLAQK
jgi:demethylmenaquinone methyltransferase/2-methoxy-6-polyprenyl-1,4-benzoquinol methylase